MGASGKRLGQGLNIRQVFEEDNDDQTHSVLKEIDPVRLELVLQHRHEYLAEKNLAVCASATKTKQGQKYSLRTKVVCFILIIRHTWLPTAMTLVERK